MSSTCATGHVISLSPSFVFFSRQQNPSTPDSAAINASKHTSATRFVAPLTLPSSPYSSRNPNISNPLEKVLIRSVNPTLFAAVAFSSFSFNHFLLGGGSSDGAGGSGGGGGGGGGGNLWSELFCSPAFADEETSEEWDSHGLPANISVPPDNLSDFKKYKVSDILLFDSRRFSNVGTEDSLFEKVSLHPNGIYTKSELKKELENLETCGMFEKVDLGGITNPDGTIAVTISFLETTWDKSERFRCINVGLMQPSKPRSESDPDMTDEEKIKLMRSENKDYKRRIQRSRPCLLPPRVQKEIVSMLRKQENVSARLLQRIRDIVQQWYHDNGYACAQVVNFGNLNTKELVCEIVEGDITQMEFQYQDKLGNVCDGNTYFPLIKREMPKQFRQGQVYNTEVGEQFLGNMVPLSLFSNIQVNPRHDEKKEGGIIVDFIFKELEQEQESAEVSTE